MKKAFRYIVLILNFFAVFALLISYLAVIVPPDKFWVPSFFGLAYPYILLANVFFIIYWIFVKPKFLFLSLLAILAGWGFFNRYIQFSGEKTEKEGIKVVSYNVRSFDGIKESDRKANANAIFDFLNRKDANIICLQEILVRKSRIFNLAETVKKLNLADHYQYASTGESSGIATITSYPIVKMKEMRYKNSGNMALYTDVLIGSDTVRIFNVHLQSYRIDPRRYGIIDSPGINEEKDVKEIREIGGKLKRAFQQRAEQVREIKKEIENTPYPVIICGDFNDTPVSYSYQQLLGDLNDAFISSGSGFVRTYIGKLPSYRIDNIFYSNSFDAYNFQADDFQASDHLPVSCLLIKK